MRPLNVLLARHGESTANVGQPAASLDSICLTPRGQAQAAALAASLTTAPDLLVVSPLRRAVETAAPILARWPHLVSQTWPIGELTYLSPQRCANTTPAQRRQWVDAFWTRADPDYLDGPDAESFAQFWTRVGHFHERVAACRSGQVLVVGHGQFFHASLMWTPDSSRATAAIMQAFRQSEQARPIANTAIVELPLRASAPSGE